MTKLRPYLNFKGNCKAAMTFYHECFGGNLNITPFAGSPMDSGGRDADAVLHSELETDDFTFFAADAMDNSELIEGTDMALCLVFDNKEKMESIYSKLSEGGIPSHPLKEEYFGTFGDCTDKFGKHWMFQMDNPKE